MDGCMRPVSPSDTNKENILLSQNASKVPPHSKDVELMDYFEESDGERPSTLEIPSVPHSQETRLMMSDHSDSELLPAEKNKGTVSESEPEDGELPHDTDDISLPSKNVENWEPVKVSAAKLEERARRFGLNSSGVSISKEELLKLYESLDVPLNLVRSGKLENIRLNTLHMRGVQEMNSADIIKYFENNEPMTIEWVNEFSCNLIFRSDASAAKAIMELSTEMPAAKGSSGAKRVDEKAENRASTSLKKESNSCSCAPWSKLFMPLSDTDIPPGKWRKGRSCAKGKSIILRFATAADDKGEVKDGYRISRVLKNQKRRRERRGRRTQRSQRYFEKYISPLRRTKLDWSSDSEEDQNILSAGGKKIRMHMYADDVEASWQRKNAQPRSSSAAAVMSKSVHQGYSSHLSSVNNSDDEQRQNQSRSVKNDVPSRYKIWNPIAENMAREAELAEKSQRYGFSRYHSPAVDNDLRSKLQESSAHQSYRQVTKSNDGDLRRKLVIKRKGGQDIHRSPLLISFQNREKQDSDSSF